jgi:hypothetical protein
MIIGLCLKNSIKTSNGMVGLRVAFRIAESFGDAVDREVQKGTGARFQFRHFGAGRRKLMGLPLSGTELVLRQPGWKAGASNPHATSWTLPRALICYTALYNS